MATGTATIEKPAGEEADVKLNQKLVDQVKHWEGEAESLTGEADALRAQAAGGIVKLLEAGATQRQVAAAIDKSPAHVAHAAKAWRILQGDDAPTGDDRFSKAYKLAKKPPTAEIETGNTGNPDPNEAEHPFPAWAKQVRTFKALAAEMIDQASLKQVQQLLKLLEKATRDAGTKEMDLESVPGS